MKKQLKKFIPSAWQIAIGCIVATAAAIFLTSLWYFAPSDNNTSQVKLVFLHYALISYGWAFLVVFIRPVIEWIDWDRTRIARSLGLFAVSGFVFSVAHCILTHGAIRGLGLLSGHGLHGPVTSFARLFGIVQSNMLLFTIIASVCLAISNERKFRERSLRASALEAQLAKAKLESLTAQLQPHFLFNSLNAIASLTQDQPKTAEAMIVKLSELLRTTLELRNNDQHRLSDEMQLITKYLDIEQIRFGDRLDVEISLDEATEQAQVPTLILQPIVENAIRHAVSRTSSACKVSIVSKKQDDRLQITVSDSGAGNQLANSSGNGVGLSNCRERLRCLFEGDFEFDAERKTDAGFRVSMVIPFQTSQAARNP